MEGQMSENNSEQLRVLTDEERIKIRDALSDEERRRVLEVFRERSMLQSFGCGTNADMVRIEARLERIEKRLDELVLK
jgi:hypothetical protein